jgi:hypothetical protein
MRKFMTAVTLAALGMALLPIAASASFDHHFTVLEKAVFNPNPNETAFRFRGKLFDRRNRHDRVGRDRGHCNVRPHATLQCRGTFHLNGEIGGFGDIKYRGNLRRRDNRLNVVGGSGDFNGVAGKWVFQSLNRSGTKSLNHFALVR